MTRSRAVGSAAAAVALLGLVAMVRAVHPHDPIPQWLVWRFLAVIALTVWWGFSCLAGGFRLVVALGIRAPLRERLLLAFATGVLAFGSVTFLVGLVGGIGGVSWALIPLGLTVLGAMPLVRMLRRARRLLTRLRRAREVSLWTFIVTGFGVVACAALYVTILHPRNLSYDAQWYHQPLAEAFAATGFVFPMTGGYFNGAMPHLGSFLYSWSYSAPVGRWFDHVEQAAHLEFLLVLVTFAAVGFFIDALTPRPRHRGAWVYRLLFPGVLLYDASPIGGADHILAFFAIPIAFTFRRFWRRPSTSSGLALGIMMGGAALSKYQAVFLLAGPCLALAVRAALSLVRRRLDFVRSVAVAGVMGLLVTAAHWLTNIFWYGNPLYPYLFKVLGGRPSFPGMKLEVGDAYWQPRGDFLEKLWETARESVLQGFTSHDWSTFHGQRPTFGSLFLIAAALIPFAVRRRQLLALGVFSFIGVAAWYWTHHQDRYLQALAPWMAAFVGAVFIMVWRGHVIARAALVALVAFQLLHLSDIYFLPTHAMLHGNSAVAAFELLASNDPNEPEALMERSFAFAHVGELVPRDGTLMIHEDRVRLGLGRRWVDDDRLLQGATDLAALETPSRLRDHFASLGVTHVWWRPQPMRLMPLGDDVAFHYFAKTALTQGVTSIVGALVAPLPPAVPPTEVLRVRVVGCEEQLMRPQELNANWDRLFGAKCGVRTVDFEAASRDADVIVVDQQVTKVPPPGFEQVFTHDRFVMFIPTRR